jgi:DNA-binding transcriptional LysR family regulator
MLFSSNVLETFIALSESGSFSAATETTHKTQAAISIQLAKLEAQLKVKLVDRSSRPVALTDAGRIFLNFAKEVINRSEEVSRHMEETARGITGEVRIGVTTSISNYLCSSVIGNVLSRNPKLKVCILARPRSIICEAVRQSDVDFGLVVSDLAPQNLLSKTLRNEPLCLAVSPKSPYFRKNPVTMRELGLIPFISGVRGTEYEDMVDTLLKRSGVSSYTVGMRISNLEGRKEAAMAGFGITVMPQFAIDNELGSNKLAVLRIRGTRLIEMSIMLVERPRHVCSPCVQVVKQIFEDTLSRV